MPSMVELSREVEAEIRALRKGRALEAPNIGDRLGPLLRELIGDCEGRSAYEIRDRLAAELARMAHRLPEELRTAVLAGLALHPATRGMARYTERTTWLAAELGRTDRTAARRMEEAAGRLSLELASELTRLRDPEIAAHAGWYLRELRSVMRFDGDRLEVLEVRRIVSTRPDLEQVTLEMYIPSRPGEPDPRPPGDNLLSTELVYGGQILPVQQSSRRRPQVLFQLPAPLQPGGEHEYMLRMQVAGGLPRPRYIFRPQRRCDLFDLRVRFDHARLPAWIREVDGETADMLEAAAPSDGHVTPDRAGEIHLQFHFPREHLAYGAQWGPSLAVD